MTRFRNPPRPFHRVLVWVALCGMPICTAAPAARAGVAGDMNCDGIRNGLDLAGFIHAVEDPKSYLYFEPACNYFDADLDANGAVDLVDAEMFIDLLMGPNDGPEATTGQITFSEQSGNVGLVLEGTYPAHPDHPLKYSIVELPGQGGLYQYNPQLQWIGAAPFDLATNWVAYAPATYGPGAPFDRIGYTVTSLVDGKTSPVRYVALNRSPSTIPLLLSVNPETEEDTPTIFQLPILYEELFPPGDVVTTKMVWTVPAIFGNLYQIESDGVTFGVVINQGDTVTHPDRLVGYIPTMNFNGNSALFIWTVEDTMGIYPPGSYNDRVCHVNVTPVNDPPTTSDNVTQASHLVPTFTSELVFSDIDSSEFTLTIHTLPEHGLLYVGFVSPENLVSTPGQSFQIGYSTDMMYQVIEPGLGSPYDQFTWSVADATAESNVATTLINIVHGNSPPIAEPVPPLFVEEDSDYTYITLTASDIDDGPLPINWQITALPTKGTLQFKNILNNWVNFVLDGQYLPTPTGDPYQVEVRYKPLADVNTIDDAPDHFCFRVMDGEADESQIETAQIYITAVNDPPVITAPDWVIARILQNGGQHVNAVVTSVRIDDDADGTALIDVSIEATNANALFMNNTAMLPYFQQRSPTSLSFSGTLEQINLALRAGFQFDPTDLSGGTITITVYDNGATGEQSPPVPLVSTAQIDVVVAQ